jgi:hypothetical protein
MKTKIIEGRPMSSAAKAEHNLISETSAVRVLKAALAEQDMDEDAIDLSVASETNFAECVSAVLAGITEDEVMIAGLNTVIAGMVERKVRLSERIERRRKAIERAMLAGDVHRLEVATATLSLRRVPPGLDITDEGSIPESYWKPQPPKLDRTLLKDAIKSGQSIPGARLDNGSVTLSMRRG